MAEKTMWTGTLTCVKCGTTRTWMNAPLEGSRAHCSHCAPEDESRLTVEAVDGEEEAPADK